MDKRYIAALDQGTTSSRTIIFDRRTMKMAAMKNKPFKQIYPVPGWVEHDPDQIWSSQLDTLHLAIAQAGISPQELACIGITNQRETVMLWDRETGKPVSNAIVWQCRRTASICEALKAKGLEDVIGDKTGLVVDAYFSGSKIKWMLDNVPGVMEMAEEGKLAAGTVDTWLLWNLTGGKVHVTDYSNASRTMLFNIRKMEWDEELLKEFGIPKCILPQVVASSGIVGETDPGILGIKIPISGIAGDQQAALFGQACYEPGTVKSTYGTGCFLLMNTGNRPVKSNNRLLTTIAWVIGNETEYALEGSVFNAGSAIQWLRDELRLISTAHEADVEAEKVSDTSGIYMVPAFTGLGAPYWDMFARGAIVGLTRGTRREHLIRATLEAIAYQCRDVMEVMKLDSGVEPKELKVDGGASVSPFLMQFQADILNLAVKRPVITETTALGAAYLAGLGIGLWNSKEEIKNEWAQGKVFTPAMENDDRERLYSGWKRAVECSRDWEKKS